MNLPHKPKGGFKKCNFDTHNKSSQHKECVEQKHRVEDGRETIVLEDGTVKTLEQTTVAKHIIQQKRKKVAQTEMQLANHRALQSQLDGKDWSNHQVLCCLHAAKNNQPYSQVESLCKLVQKSIMLYTGKIGSSLDEVFMFKSLQIPLK